MRLDSDPPRLSSQGDPLLRTALQQARADLPGPDALARLAARLPLGPGPGPSGAPPDGAAAGGGGAGAAGLASSAPMLSSIVIGAAAGVVASCLLWVADPDVLKPPERLDGPAPVQAAPAESPRPSVPASEPEIRARSAAPDPGALRVPVSAAPEEQAKARDAPSAPAAAREQEVIASPAEAVSAAGVAKGSGVSGAAPAAENETEASLLTRAQAQIGSSPSGALSLADRHRALFPNGNMAQEREFIAVSALVALSRTAEARSRAEAFLAAHPQSAHRRRLSALVPGLAGGTEENP